MELTINLSLNRVDCKKIIENVSDEVFDNFYKNNFLTHNFNNPSFFENGLRSNIFNNDSLIKDTSQLFNLNLPILNSLINSDLKILRLSNSKLNIIKDMPKLVLEGNMFKWNL